MSDANIYVSNGTCYSAPGNELDGSFIPCGNDAFGHQTCCGKGDNCLADNACFGIHGSGYGSYLTYMAGCTDSGYQDSTCPDKEGIDQPWIALTLCDNTDGVWAACSQEGNPTTLQPGSYCSCTDTASATVAFTDASSLTNIASLPQSTGASIQFFAGHIPTSAATGRTTTAETTSSSAGTATTAGTTAASSSSTIKVSQSTQTAASTDESGSATTATRTIIYTSSIEPTSSGGSTGSTASGSDSSSSGSGTKIGIGIGVGVGIVLLLAVLVTFLVYRRRKRRHALSEIEKGGNATGTSTGSKHTSVDPRVSEADGQAISEADGKAVSRADKFAMAEAGGQPISEIDRNTVPRSDKLATPEAGGTAVRPLSMRSELEGSPVTPISAQSAGRFARPGGTRRSGDLSPVAELSGSNSWRINHQGLAQETPTTPTAIGGVGYAPAPGRSRWGEVWRKRSS